MPTVPIRHPIADYRPALLAYTFNEQAQCFAHNFERDLHVFVLWEKSQPQWDRILADLAADFQVLYRARVTWSPECVDDNFLRLYGMPPERRGTPSKRRELVGGGAFMLIVVEDVAPAYAYDRTFSQKVEIVNRNVVAAKASYREWTGGGFRVHSSNSLGEFFRDATLLLGASRLAGILSRRAADTAAPESLSLDLAGAQGWASLGELFLHLARASDVIVLRNFDSLPAALPPGDADLDVLCRDPSDLAALVGGTVVVASGGKFACETQVAGESLHVDVRFVGDGYYDERWQDRMLTRAWPTAQGVMVPSVEDHFFALLYHAKVHKPDVKPAYRERLRALGSQLGLAAYGAVDLSDDDVAAGLLAGFLVSSGYRVATPLDVWVGFNRRFVTKLQHHGLLWARERERDTLQVSAMLARAPLLWRWHRRLAVPATNAWRALKRIVHPQGA